LLIAGSLDAQTQPLDTARVVAAIRAEMQSTAAPGASIAIVIGDRVAYAGAFGVRSVETRDAMSTSSLVRIGSVTKSFTGLTAAIMASDRKLDLHAAINRYAPDIHRALGSRTSHQLLTHTAGLGDEGAGDGSGDVSALERRVKAWGDERIMGVANDIYSYSSPGYWLAGYILQRVDGVPFPEVVQNRLLGPLGMHHSTFDPLDAMTRSLALDHRVTNGIAAVLRPFQNDASTWPSGSLFSSVDELARFAMALMNEGVIDGHQVIPGDAVTAMFARNSGLPGSPCRYSYGLSVCDRGPFTTASHYGFRVGSGAVFTLVPARKIGVIILANRNGAIFRRTEAEVLRMLLGDAVNARPATVAEPPQPTAAEKQRFVGRWASGRDTLHVTQRRDSLFYRYGTNEQRASASSATLLYVLDANGNPMQQFQMIKGAVSGVDYLTDGLNAFRRQ
jgi:CubicO group peptidase (beta-lactamase class C family)